MDSDIIIEVKDVSIKFNLGSEKIDNLKEYIIKLVKKQLFYEEFWALQDINLSVKKGECVGLVGKNGCGKSTLLKCVAGVMQPSKGYVRCVGSIAPMIELGAGFDMDLTARENIFLNGTTIGLSKAMLNRKFDRIVEFAELENFIDVPLKNFSSGMLARLGFAISTCEMPDILILDEVLAVGDYRFQEKCERRIRAMMENGVTILFVSHSIDQIAQICSRAVLMKQGRIILDSDVDTVKEVYMREDYLNL